MKGKYACTKCSFYIDISCHKWKSVTIKEPDCDQTVVYNPGFSLVFADFRKQNMPFHPQSRIISNVLVLEEPY